MTGTRTAQVTRNCQATGTGTGIGIGIGIGDGDGDGIENGKWE